MDYLPQSYPLWVAYRWIDDRILNPSADGLAPFVAPVIAWTRALNPVIPGTVIETASGFDTGVGPWPCWRVGLQPSDAITAWEIEWPRALDKRRTRRERDEQRDRERDEQRRPIA